MDIDQEKDDLPMDQEQSIVDAPTIADVDNAEPALGSPDRDEHGRFKAKEKGEKEEAPPASDPVNVPVTALQEERRKRQELEQEIAAIKQQFAQANAEPPPSLWEDENRWQQNLRSQIMQETVQFTALNARLDTSEMLSRQAHANDFEEMKAKFLEMAQQTPQLQQQALSDPHPWEKAYQIAKNARTMEELGANSLEDVIKAERAKWEAELKSVAPKFPTSTVQDGSVASRGGPVWSGPVSDRDILPMG